MFQILGIVVVWSLGVFFVTAFSFAMEAPKSTWEVVRRYLKYYFLFPILLSMAVLGSVHTKLDVVLETGAWCYYRSRTKLPTFVFALLHVLALPLIAVWGVVWLSNQVFNALYRFSNLLIGGGAQPLPWPEAGIRENLRMRK
jgi:hypothetical protein